MIATQKLCPCCNNTKVVIDFPTGGGRGCDYCTSDRLLPRQSRFALTLGTTTIQTFGDLVSLLDMLRQRKFRAHETCAIWMISDHDAYPPQLVAIARKCERRLVTLWC